MPLDDMIRAAMREAAHAVRFPQTRDGLALQKQAIKKEEDERNG